MAHELGEIVLHPQRGPESVALGFKHSDNLAVVRVSSDRWEVWGVNGAYGKSDQKLAAFYTDEAASAYCDAQTHPNDPQFAFMP